MIRDFVKIDDDFDRGEDRPENKDEYAAELRLYPDGLPATHVWDYHWEETATAQNPRSLPNRVYGVRERTLAEISAATDNFATLKLKELQSLTARHNVKTPDFNKDRGPVDDETMLLEAIQAHFKANPKSDVQPHPKAVQKSSEAATGFVLPTDLAKMTEAQLKTVAAKIDCYPDYNALSGKSLAYRREWLAKKRTEFEAATKNLPETAVVS